MAQKVRRHGPVDEQELVAAASKDEQELDPAAPEGHPCHSTSNSGTSRARKSCRTRGLRSHAPPSEACSRSGPPAESTDRRGCGPRLQPTRPISSGWTDSAGGLPPSREGFSSCSPHALASPRSKEARAFCPLKTPSSAESPGSASRRVDARSCRSAPTCTAVTGQSANARSLNRCCRKRETGVLDCPARRTSPSVTRQPAQASSSSGDAGAAPSWSPNRARPPAVSPRNESRRRRISSVDVPAGAASSPPCPVTRSWSANPGSRKCPAARSRSGSWVEAHRSASARAVMSGAATCPLRAVPPEYSR